MGERLSKHFGTDHAVRHGERRWDRDELTEEGKAHIRERAKDFFKKIQNLSLGSVFYFMSSGIERAIETRQILEETVRDLAKDDPTIEFVDFKDTTRVAQIKTDQTKRWVVINGPVADGVGLWRTHKGTAEAHRVGYEHLKAKIKDEVMQKIAHDLITKVSVALPHELPALFDELRGHMEEQPSNREMFELFDPRPFLGFTPEEAAIRQIRGTASNIRRIEGAFPGKSVSGVTVTHAPTSDFAAMALLGTPISLRTWNEVGGIRDFVEGSTVVIKPHGELEIAESSFRDRTGKPIDLDSVVDRLRKQSAARKAAWDNFNPATLT